MKVGNWVFVTGAPRSGTTFAGLVLSLPLRVDYIHEPFNPDCGLPGIRRRFLYVRSGDAGEPRYRAMVEAMMRYDFRLRTGLYPEDGAVKRLVKRVVGSRGPFYLRLAKVNLFRRAAVVKDPIGCLLLHYLAVQFGFRVLCLVRHPVAFVASHLRLGWDVQRRLDDLAGQPGVIEDFFGGRRDGLRPRTDEPVVVAATLWRALNIDRKSVV